MRWTALIPAVAVFAAAGCDVNPFDGPEASAEYELVSIDGEPLPAAAVVNENNVPQVVVISSRLVLYPNRRGEEHGRQQFPQNDGNATVDISAEFSYRIDGNEIWITYDCPDLASCIAGPHLIGRLSDDGILVDVALGRTPRVYRRR
ncbi:MAG: hypothetical protein ACKVZ0_22855 [Gemmatimonadales bacterium]